MGMAKRNYSKRRSSKIEPAVQTLTFVTPSTSAGAVGSHTIDLSQVASLVNRRFYRQGINWAVAGFKIFGAAPGAIAIQKLPNTWILSNSWEKSMRAWMKMNREALAESESVRPKFLDFKIYADNLHHQAGYAANLLPRDSALNAATPGEWEASKFVIPTSGTTGAATDFEIIGTGASFPGPGASTLNAVSLIEGYAASRGLPEILDPNVPGDAADVGPTATPENWLGSLFNEGTDQDKQVLADMISENNIAPYPFENDGVHVDTMYPGGANQMPALQTHDQSSITNTTIGGTTMMKGGNFPCGLVRIQHAPQETSNLVIQVDLIPGNHRGYLCEPMTEM